MLDVGRMARVLKKGWVQDTTCPSIDNRVRGYVLNMEISKDEENEDIDHIDIVPNIEIE